MTALTIMADKLNQELQSRGVFSIGRTDCVEIIRNVIDHAADVKQKTDGHRLQETAEIVEK